MEEEEQEGVVEGEMGVEGEEEEEKVGPPRNSGDP